MIRTSVIHKGKSPIWLATTPGEVVKEEIFRFSTLYRSCVAIATRSHAHFEDS